MAHDEQRLQEVRIALRQVPANCRCNVRPAEQPTSLTAPWPFAQWGIDLIDPLPMGKVQTKFAVVAINYFTKWAEAKPFAAITERNITALVWKSIICQCGIPNTIISDNGKQFEKRNFKRFCLELNIKQLSSTPMHSQTNGKIEAVNKVIKKILKARLEKLKGQWAEKLPSILWAYRTTPKTLTGETLYSLSFGIEVVVPVEMEVPQLRIQAFDKDLNNEGIFNSLDLMEEHRETARLRVAQHQS